MPLRLPKLALVAAFALSLALPANAPRAATPDDQLVIAISMAQFSSLDPGQTTEGPVMEVVSSIYDRLVAMDPADPNKVVPQLAESWEVGPDKITFRLREGAKFHSGNPVTAADAVWSITRLMKLNQASATFLKRLNVTAANVDAFITAPDPRTVVVTIPPGANAEFMLFALARSVCAVVDSAVAKQHVANDDYGNGWLRANSAGSGPFRLARWAPNDILLLERNDAFWGAKAKMRRVVMRHIPESQVQRLLLERGDIDVARALNATDLKALAENKSTAIQSVAAGSIWYLSMNAEHPVLRNEDARRALAWLIDYKGIETSILGPLGRTRQAPVAQAYPGAIPDPGYVLDVEKAKALLAKAGVPEGFDLTLKIIAETPRVEMATALQASMAKAGVRVKVVQGAGNQMITDHRERNFDLYIGVARATMPNGLGTLESFASNPDNRKEAGLAGNVVWRSAWDIPELTKLVDTATRERDPETRVALYGEIQRKFIAAGPALLPIFEQFEPFAHRADLVGFKAHPFHTTRMETAEKRR